MLLSRKTICNTMGKILHTKLGKNRRYQPKTRKTKKHKPSNIPNTSNTPHTQRSNKCILWNNKIRLKKIPNSHIPRRTNTCNNSRIHRMAIRKHVHPNSYKNILPRRNNNRSNSNNNNKLHNLQKIQKK